MANKDYYPEGAANDPRAPYNQHEPELMAEIADKETDGTDTIVQVTWYADGRQFSPCGNYTTADCFSLREFFEFKTVELEGLNDGQIIDLIYEKEELA